MSKTFTEKELRDFINQQQFLNYEEQEEFAKQLGIRLAPRKAEVTTYIFKEFGSQNGVVFCESALGITGGFGYTDVLKHVKKGFGETGFGGTKVKVTIEEVLD